LTVGNSWRAGGFLRQKKRQNKVKYWAISGSLRAASSFLDNIPISLPTRLDAQMLNIAKSVSFGL
jgi:hypothetical protein